MAYTLRSSGIATNLVACVAVDQDNTIKDFKGAPITLGTGVAASVSTATWKGVSQKYFVCTANGVANFFGVVFDDPEPTVNEADGDGVHLWFACNGASDDSNNSTFVGIASAPGDKRGLGRVPGGNKGAYIFGGGTPATTTSDIPNDGTTKFSLGGNYRSGTSSEIFYGLESGSLASEASEAELAGWGGTRGLNEIGGQAGQGNQPFKPFIVCLFNRQLSEAEVQSLHDDWFGALFEDPPPPTFNAAWAIGTNVLIEETRG